MTQEINMKNTKAEIMKAYEEALSKLKEKQQQKLEPEKMKESKKQMELINTAEKTISDDISQEIEKLEKMIGSQLSEIGKKLTAQKDEYQQLKEAVQIRKNELKEIYDIESEALTLTALIETHKNEEESYKIKMEETKTDLETEIKKTKEQWEEEKAVHAAFIKERNDDDKKQYQRMKEEWEYAFKRQKELAANEFADEKTALEKELTELKESTEKHLTAKEQELNTREKAVTEKEQQISELETQVAAFDKTLADTITQVRTETIEKLTEQFSSQENLLKKQYEGEINVLNTRIATLEALIEDQKLRMQSMSKQLDASYRKVEEIAMKALDSSSSTKTVDSLEKMLSRQERQKEA